MKVTKGDIKTWTDECTHWQEELSLWDWDIGTGMIPIDEDIAGCAVMQTTARVAEIIFNVNCLEDLTADEKKREFKDTAVHEMIHVLLAELRTLAESRDWDERAWESAEHAVVNRLVKALRYGKNNKRS